MSSVRKPPRGRVAGAAAAVMMAACGLGLTLIAAITGLAGNVAPTGTCAPSEVVGATEYGGPGDPASGTVGASGTNLQTAPDSFAELGGTTFATADALGGLPYGTPLEIAARGNTVVAFKEDIGLGGGPIDGRPRAIDLWWRLAAGLGIPYEDGRWAGTVRITPLTGGCAGSAGAGSAGAGSAGAGTAAAGVPGAAAPGPEPLAPGHRAILMPDGAAAAPASAPAVVRGMIAAGNQIVGRPYLYGGGHGLPLNLIAPGYDCSSSVAHLLYGGGLLPAQADMTSGEFEHWGLPGPGRWVSIYASATHVFMYVAGLRWDTWNAAGPGDGSSGIGWHPLVRSEAGFVVRHPPGL